jgi:hypothetical protein
VGVVGVVGVVHGGVGDVGDLGGVVCVGVWGCGGVGEWGCGVVSPCVRTFQGLHSVRLWTPTILNYQISRCKQLLTIFSSEN